MLKGFPCKVTDYSTAKPGKHGSAKATIVGNDIFTGKKYEDSAPTSSTMQVPNVSKIEMEIADIDEDDFVHAINEEDGSLKQDLKLPTDDEETYKELKKLWSERGERLVYLTVLNSTVSADALAAKRSARRDRPATFARRAPLWAPLATGTTRG